MPQVFEKANDFSGFGKVDKKVGIAKPESVIQFEIRKCHTDWKSLTTFLVLVRWMRKLELLGVRVLFSLR